MPARVINHRIDRSFRLRHAGDMRRQHRLGMRPERMLFRQRFRFADVQDRGRKLSFVERKLTDAGRSSAIPSGVEPDVLGECIAHEACQRVPAITLELVAQTLRCDVAMQTAAGVDREVASAPALYRLDPWAYLSDVITRIHNHPSHRIDELLSHRWQPG
jgi:hypothetical protein